MTSYRYVKSLYILLLLTFVVGCSRATTDEEEYASAGSYGVREIVSGLGVPWAMTFISDTEILITERQGEIKKLNLENGELTPVSGVPDVWANGQGGLMDIATPPEYEGDGWLYLTYSKPVADGAATALARARLEGDRLAKVEDLFVSNHVSDSGRHFGSRIAFDGEGHIFFSHGDRGDRPSAQNLGDHAGSIFRLNLDGSVPEDNPFVGRDGAMPEIWSYGHRNPQGLDYDPEGRLWSNEHGPRGGDEINLVAPGNNYGWPVISYGKEYAAPMMVGESTHKEGMEQPVKYYVPSIAPGDLIHYRGDRYPALRGSLLSTALKLMHLNQVEIEENGKGQKEIRYLEEKSERLRGIVAGPDDRIYLSTDSGKIWELLPE